MFYSIGNEMTIAASHVFVHLGEQVLLCMIRQAWRAKTEEARQNTNLVCSSKTFVVRCSGQYSCVQVNRPGGSKVVPKKISCISYKSSTVIHRSDCFEVDWMHFIFCSEPIKDVQSSSCSSFIFLYFNLSH